MANESSVLVRLRLLGGAAFARESKTASRGLGSIGKQGGIVSKSLGGVNRVLGYTAAAMRTVGTAGAVAVGAGLAYGVKKAANFEQSMANVQARLLTTKKNMGLLNAQALQLGADTSFSAQQAADAMGEFAAAGFNAQQIMAIMPGTLNLAAAAGSDLAFAAETSGAIIRQFGLHATDAGHVADVLTLAVNKSAISLDDMALSMKYVGPVAGRFNQTLEDMSAAVAILGNVGIKGETAGTTLRAAMVRLVRPTMRTMNVLDDMGISEGRFAKITTDAHGRLRPMPDILGRLAGAFKGLTAPQQRKALAQLFGTEALPGMVTLMGMGKKRIDRMSASLDHSGGAAKRTAAIMRGTVKGAWDNLTGSIESATIAIAQRFNPVLRSSLNRAAGLVDRAGRGLQQFVGAVSGPATRKPTVARGRMTGVGDQPAKQLTGAQKAGIKARGIINSVITWAQANLPKIGASVAKIAAQVVDAFKPAQPFFQNVLLPLLKGIAVGVIGSVVGAFKVLIPTIKILMTGLGFLGTILRPFRGVFYGIGVAIGFLASGPILKVLGGLKYVGLAFRALAVPVRLANALFGTIFRVAGRVVGGFVRLHLSVLRFVGTFTSAPARVARGMLNIVGSVIHAAESIIAKLASIGSRIGKALLDGIANAIKGAPGVISGAILGVIPDKLKSVAKKIIPGIATGGRVTRGGVAMVGERGPELAHFPTGTTVYDAAQTRRARTSMAAPAPIYVTANLHLSGKLVHTEIVKVDRAQAEVR